MGGSLTETFVVRLWEAPQQAGGREPAALRGVVRHAHSGRSAAFTGDESLLAFLRTTRGARERDDTGA